MNFTRKPPYIPRHVLPPFTVSMAHTRYCVQCFRRCWFRAYRHRLSPNQRRRFVIENAPFHRVCWVIYEKAEYGGARAHGKL